MMPVHCKDVAFKRVDFPLTEERIRRRMVGERVFTRTEYFILENGGEYAVARVKKRRGIQLFREVLEAEVISLPGDTAFVRDPGCDVLNPHAMVKHAVAHKQETVVVHGTFEHVSFIKGEKSPPVLRVVDVVPPHPSKTLEMVEMVLRAGTVATPLLVEPVLLDATGLASGRKADVFMFPCEAGRIAVAGRPVVYLDKTPPLKENESVTLVGCQLSMRIFRCTYGREPDFVNTCPRDLARLHFEPGKLHIARCCDVHQVIVEDGLALVQYGARMEEIAAAIRQLTQKDAEQRIKGHGAGTQTTNTV